jgi:6-phosphogluconolactonase (cycloisomerase 2 family)
MLTPNASDTSSFITFSVGDAKALAMLQKETYTLAAPGPVADRQDAPHLHDAVLDPTKKFILVPDLGSDLVRVYKAGSGTMSVSSVSTIKAVPGSGPRHCAFAVAGQNTFFYTVNELGNSITGYSVSYKGDSTPEFNRLFDFSTHGPGGIIPNGTKAAEIVVSVSGFNARHI